MGKATDETPGGRGTDVLQAGEVRSARIESLRALAALGVLVGHVFGYSHGFDAAADFGTYFDRVVFGGGFGVYLFFALSGYLIYWPFARRDFGGGASIDFRRYASNRALRILPLYWIAVIVVALISGAAFADWWHYMVFAENYFSINAIDGPLWSVVVEIQFYILLPLLAFGIAAVSSGSRLRAALVISALGLLSLAARYVLVIRGGHSYLWQYNFPTVFLFFTGGMLVAILRTAWERRRPAWVRGPLDSSTVWLLASVPLWLLVFYRYDLSPLLALAGGLMVAACVLPLRQGVLTRGLDWRPVALIGVASYSLYVWHIPILNALTHPDFTPVSWVPSGFWGLATVAIPLSLAAAFVSYWLIETPFLRLRRRWSPASADIEPSKAAGEPAPAPAPAD